MACNALKAEFRKRNFLYSFHDGRAFYGSFLKMPHPVFVAIRVLMALYSLYALTHFLVNNTWLVLIQTHVMVYFTTWSYIVLTAHLALAALLSVVFYKVVNYDRPLRINAHRFIAYRSKSSSHSVEVSSPMALKPMDAPRADLTLKRKSLGTHKEGAEYYVDNTGINHKTGIASVNETIHSTHESFHGDPSCESVQEPTKWYFQISWGLSDVVACVSPVVTSVYFVVIYPKLVRPQGINLFFDVNMHVLNSVFMIVDFVFSARPIRVLHMWAPVLYGVCWVVFSVVYWSTDPEKHIIYDFIDWSKPGMTLAWTSGLTGGLVFLMFVFFALYRFKIWLYTVIYREEHFIVIDDE